MSSGLITDIQRFSVHDGPGIRTTVFFKGCNMRCAWCHNPETISLEPEVLIDPDKCIHCGKCAEGCFSGARRTVGIVMQAREVLQQVMLDHQYYGETGGVTFSGGEPTLQSAFLSEMLDLAHDNGLHCAMESNMLTSPETLKLILPKLDLLMCDIKMFDHTLHHRWTGVGNNVILRNIKYAGQSGTPMIVRIPMIGGINDTEDNIMQTASFLKAFPGLLYLEFLPYHPLGLSKHLESGYTQSRFEKPSWEHMEQLATIARQSGIQVRISGKATQ